MAERKIYISMNDPRIERHIIIGMIVSQEYLQGIRPIWSTKLLKAPAAKRIGKWCIEFFDNHRKAPGKSIETIYLHKLKEDRLTPDTAEEIEQDILPGLSDEYDAQQFNVDYLLEKTKQYFKERHLEEHCKEIQGALEQGELLEAEKAAGSYQTIANAANNDIDLSDIGILEKIEHAFTKAVQPIIRFPGALGELWNGEMVRGGFISLMASEKRGKSFWLLEFADRGVKQGLKVAFFQAGDMTEAQQLRRVCIKKSRKPIRELKPHKRFLTTKDCIHNQTDDCNKEVRECDHGIFLEKEARWMKEKGFRNSMEMKTLHEKYTEYPDYRPCHNCKEYKEKHWGVPWIKPMEYSLLNVKEAKKAIEKYFIRKKRRLKISTHANGTLSVREIRGVLEVWERQDDFVPDLIIIDYADLLIAPEVKDFRHRQDAIWKELRGLSQEKHCLVITATQADAKSYEQDRLKLSNFSEDKRKYAHITAMYGLNQDPHGREKELGIMRINELVVRESEFYTTREVYVLQNLNIGQPCLSSYW